MVDQCSNCFFGQTTQTIGSDTVRVCRQKAPLPINQASGVATALWQPVRDSDWCGDGANNSTGVSYSANVIQIPGSTAAAWLYGSGVPNVNLGSVGFFYLDTSNGDVYMKTSNGWGTPVANIMGPAGVNAPQWFFGAGPPSGGNNGDFYWVLGAPGTNVISKKANGLWGPPIAGPF